MALTCGGMSTSDLYQLRIAYKKAVDEWVNAINVPFYDGKTAQYPAVKLRMDFRDPKLAGTFLYHCHLLEHEDNGMMGLIRMEPSGPR